MSQPNLKGKKISVGKRSHFCPRSRAQPPCACCAAWHLALIPGRPFELAKGLWNFAIGRGLGERAPRAGLDPFLGPLWRFWGVQGRFWKPLALGLGLWRRQNNKYKLQIINTKHNGLVPGSISGSKHNSSVWLTFCIWCQKTSIVNTCVFCL